MVHSKVKGYAILHAHQFHGQATSNPRTSQGAIIRTQELQHQNLAHLSSGHLVDPQEPTEVCQWLGYP